MMLVMSLLIPDTNKAENSFLLSNKHLFPLESQYKNKTTSELKKQVESLFVRLHAQSLNESIDIYETYSQLESSKNLM